MLGKVRKVCDFGAREVPPSRCAPDQQNGCACHQDAASAGAHVFAFCERCQSEAGDTGQSFKHAGLPTVSAFAQVACNRLASQVGQSAGFVHMESKRRREAFFAGGAGFVRGVWFPGNNDGHNALFAADAFEITDLLVDPSRGGGRGRTQHDEVARGFERALDSVAQICGKWQLVAVAENGEETFRRRFAITHRAPDQIARHPVVFKAPVQAASHCLVLRRVGNKRPVGFVMGFLFHGSARRGILGLTVAQAGCSTQAKLLQDTSHFIPPVVAAGIAVVEVMIVGLAAQWIMT